eukprot:3496579-Rhodomonas_salina.4
MSASAFLVTFPAYRFSSVSGRVMSGNFSPKNRCSMTPHAHAQRRQSHVSQRGASSCVPGRRPALACAEAVLYTARPSPMCGARCWVHDARRMVVRVGWKFRVWSLGSQGPRF